MQIITYLRHDGTTAFPRPLGRAYGEGELKHLLDHLVRVAYPGAENVQQDFGQIDSDQPIMTLDYRGQEISFYGFSEA